MKIALNNSRDCRLIKTFCVIITFLMVKNILFTVSFIRVYQNLVNIVFIGLCVLLFLLSSFDILARSLKSILICLFAVVIFILVQYIFFPQNWRYVLSDLPSVIVYGLIPFFLICSIQDYKLLLNSMISFSYVIVGCAIIVMILFFLNKDQNVAYSMSYGNCSILGVAFIEYNYLVKRKPIDLILFIVGSISIFLVGSRGPILVVLALFVLYELLIERSGRRHLLLIILLSALAIFFEFFYEEFLSLLQITLNSMNINSRAVNLILKGKFFYLSGRDSVFALCRELIHENSLWGIGYMGLQGLGYTNLTPHNTYYEFVLYYGIIFGIISLAVLISFWLYGLYANKGSALQHLCIIFVALYVSRSFTGAGTFTNQNFWILLGLSIASSKEVHFKSYENYFMKENNGEQQGNI